MNAKMFCHEVRQLLPRSNGDEDRRFDAERESGSWRWDVAQSVASRACPNLVMQVGLGALHRLDDRFHLELLIYVVVSHQRQSTPMHLLIERLTIQVQPEKLHARIMNDVGSSVGKVLENFPGAIAGGW